MQIMQDKNCNQIDKYVFHKTLFKITDSPQLLIFKKYLHEEKIPFSLECSCKLDSNQIFSERFNMWYKDGKYFPVAVKGIVSFFRELSRKGDFKMDLPRFRNIIGDIDYDKTAQIILGVDFRKDFSDSRAKLWFILKDNPRKIADLLTQYDYEIRDQVKSSIISDTLLYGFDFYPSGRIDTKIYPIYYEKDIPSLRERGLLPNSERLSDMLNRSNSFHISFKNTVSDKIYHMRPKDPDRFIQGLNNKDISTLYSMISGFSGRNTVIVSISEKEIISGRITSANIYY